MIFSSDLIIACVHIAVLWCAPLPSQPTRTLFLLIYKPD